MNMKARKLPGKFAPFLTELLKIKSIRLLGLHEIICQIDYRSTIGFHGIFIQSHLQKITSDIENCENHNIRTPF